MKKRSVIASSLVALLAITSLNFTKSATEVISKIETLNQNVLNIENKLLSDNYNKARKINGFNIEGGALKEIDYSGKGTVILNTVNTKYCATEKYRSYKTTDDMLSIPVYRGKYNKKRASKTGRWSEWSTNKPDNKTYTEYSFAGSKIEENEIESKIQKRYYNISKKLKYKTLYTTWFRGNKWWNRLVTYYKITDYRIYSAPANFSIISSYPTLVPDGYTEYREYDNTWRDRAPWGWGNYIWDTREVYRYRTKTYTWDTYAEKIREEVPLYHSLYNRDGSPLKKGIMLESNHDISMPRRGGNGETTSIYNTKCFYLPTSVLEETIINDIINCTEDDEISYEAKKSSKVFQYALPEILSFFFGKFGERRILKSFCKTGSIVGFLLFSINYQNDLLHEKKDAIVENLKSTLLQLDNYNLLSVSFSKHFSYGGDNTYSFAPNYTLDVSLVDRKDNLKDNVNYISMDYFDNIKADGNNYIPYRNIETCDAFYGNIKYEENFEDLYQVLRTYFSSYNIYNIEAWFDNLMQEE